MDKAQQTQRDPGRSEVSEGESPKIRADVQAAPEGGNAAPPVRDVLARGRARTAEQHSEHRTSASYRGLQDEDYPVEKDMGYPSSRPFRDAVSSAAAAHDNMPWRTICIRRRSS